MDNKGKAWILSFLSTALIFSAPMVTFAGEAAEEEAAEEEQPEADTEEIAVPEAEETAETEELEVIADADGSGETLPETATAVWTVGLIGLMLASTGTLIHFKKKRK